MFIVIRERNTIVNLKKNRFKFIAGLRNWWEWRGDQKR